MVSVLFFWRGVGDNFGKKIILFRFLGVYSSSIMYPSSSTHKYNVLSYPSTFPSMYASMSSSEILPVSFW